jgi:hypothetical protein
MILPLKPRSSRAEAAQFTGPLDALKDRSVLVLADDENLRASAQDLGHKLSYKTLREKICEASGKCKLHVFFSREKGDDRRTTYFEDRKWVAHPRDIHEVQTGRGVKRTTNSDFMITFLGGMLVSRSDADVIVIASGDGDMVADMAETIKSLPRPRLVMTMSLAGSTAWRLNAESNAFIDVNIEIGLDCLRPVRSDQPSFHRQRFSAHGMYRGLRPNSLGAGHVRFGQGAMVKEPGPADSTTMGFRDRQC